MNIEDTGTINVSGPDNRPPRIVWKPCAVSDLIDGFIRDGWIAAEDKWIEIAYIYKGQLEAKGRDLTDLRARLEAQAYAASWVSRWLCDQEDMKTW